jgi:exonuclease III
LEIKAQHPKTPVIIAGDLNGNASRHHTEPEFVDLYQRTDFEDVLELVGTKPENRWTFYQVRAGGGRQDGKQLDYVFLDSRIKDNLVKDTCRVLKYKDEFGFELDWPMTLEAKLELPSDHYPLVFELEKLKVW